MWKETGRHKILLILHMDTQVSISQSFSNTLTREREWGPELLSYKHGRSKEAIRQASLMLCSLGALRPGL